MLILLITFENDLNAHVMIRVFIIFRLFYHYVIFRFYVVWLGMKFFIIGFVYVMFRFICCDAY